MLRPHCSCGRARNHKCFGCFDGRLSIEATWYSIAQALEVIWAGHSEGIELLLLGRPSAVGRNSDCDNRLFVEAAIWTFRSGAPGHDLPERFGAWNNIHTRFSRWAKSNVWENLFKTLADDPDNEYAMIDATIVCELTTTARALKKRRLRPSHSRLA